MAAASRRRRRSGDFEPDHESFGRFMLSDQASDPVMQVTRLIAGEAARITPRSDKDHQHVADSYDVHDVVVEGVGKPPGPRRAGEITNDAPAAVPNEFGAGEGVYLRPVRAARGNRSLRKAAEPWHDPKVER